MFEDLERTIITKARDLKAGEPGAADGLIAALRRVPTDSPALVPLITSLLEFEHADVQVFAACALAGQAKGAVSAIPALRKLMLQQKGAPADAAASALGSIPHEDSVQALVAALPVMKDWSAAHILGALGRLAALAAPALPALEKLERAKPPLSEDAVWHLAECLKAIRTALRYQYQEDLSVADFGSRLKLEDAIRDPQGFAAEQGEELQANQEGLVVNRRFRYSVGNCPGECGLRIYASRDGEWIVVVSHDGMTYGPSITNNAEYLATAICARYGIDPKKLSWIERYSNQSGMQARNEATLVNFKVDGLIFSNPVWRPIESAGAFLRERRIEW